jgi:FixJ family two-component response regulator
MNGQTVYIVDDDDAIRDSLRMLFTALKISAETFGSAAAFLTAYRRDWSGCIVLDIRMPGMSGLVMQEELAKRRITLPVVFLSGHADVPIAVRALKQGAYDFIEKPLEAEILVPAVMAALEADAVQRKQQSGQEGIAINRNGPLEELTEREQQVLRLLLEGKSSRYMAEELKVSVKTIEFHRAKIREKLGVTSLAELFRLFPNGL